MSQSQRLYERRLLKRRSKCDAIFQTTLRSRGKSWNDSAEALVIGRYYLLTLTNLIKKKCIFWLGKMHTVNKIHPLHHPRQAADTQMNHPCTIHGYGQNFFALKFLPFHFTTFARFARSILSFEFRIIREVRKTQLHGNGFVFCWLGHSIGYSRIHSPWGEASLYGWSPV